MSRFAPAPDVLEQKIRLSNAVYSQLERVERAERTSPSWSSLRWHQQAHDRLVRKLITTLWWVGAIGVLLMFGSSAALGVLVLIVGIALACWRALRRSQTIDAAKAAIAARSPYSQHRQELLDELARIWSG